MEAGNELDVGSDWTGGWYQLKTEASKKWKLGKVAHFVCMCAEHRNAVSVRH